ncbi:MAG TPA: winged helix-turn-helix transcriptional regulator [Candidatus Nitrosotalea sp.]|nr:winged helix-turn-helix transcriptional regulator [Candidatus Nitrosotalea sp.]
MKSEENNLERIFLYIKNNPGCHLRQIKRDLNLAMGTVQYHLNNLEKSGKIISEKFNLQRYYFLTGVFKENEKNTLKILNQSTARQILMLILERKRVTQSEIVDNIKISAASVNWHMKRLVELGMIFETKEGKFRIYQIAMDSSEIIGLLKNYHPNLWNKWSDRLAEMFLSLGSGSNND